MTKDANAARVRILEAALALVREEGPKALTQPRVAKAAGMSQSHLTYYFPRRNDLILAVARHASAATFTELQGVLTAQPVARHDGSAKRTFGLIKTLMGDRARTRLILTLLIEADEDEEIRAAVLEWVSTLRGLTALGLGKTLDDPEVDLTLAMLWGLGMQHLILGDSRDAAFTEQLLSLASERIGGFLADGSSRKKGA